MRLFGLAVVLSVSLVLAPLVPVAQPGEQGVELWRSAHLIAKGRTRSSGTVSGRTEVISRG
jgi:hypothetical protein